jgi:hypothetical protein
VRREISYFVIPDMLLTYQAVSFFGEVAFHPVMQEYWENKYVLRTGQQYQTSPRMAVDV